MSTEDSQVFQLWAAIILCVSLSKIQPSILYQFLHGFGSLSDFSTAFSDGLTFLIINHKSHMKYTSAQFLSQL